MKLSYKENSSYLTGKNFTKQILVFILVIYFSQKQFSGDVFCKNRKILQKQNQPEFQHHKLNTLVTITHTHIKTFFHIVFHTNFDSRFSLVLC